MAHFCANKTMSIPSNTIRHSINPQKITVMIITSFNARLKSKHTFAEALHGRLGPFIFRTYPDGVIRAHYAPRKGALSGRSRINFESLSGQLREIAASMGLEIMQINYDCQ